MSDEVDAPNFFNDLIMTTYLSPSEQLYILQTHVEEKKNQHWTMFASVFVGQILSCSDLKSLLERKGTCLYKAYFL